MVLLLAKRILLILQCVCTIQLNIVTIIPGSLWDFKRDEIIDNANVTNDNNGPSFKYKASLIGNPETNGDH